MKELFVRRDRNTIGPLTIAQFKEAVASGKVVGTDHVAESSDGPWHLVAKVPFRQKQRKTDSVANDRFADSEDGTRRQEQELERQQQLRAQGNDNFPERRGDVNDQEETSFDEMVADLIGPPEVESQDQLELLPLEDEALVAGGAPSTPFESDGELGHGPGAQKTAPAPAVSSADNSRNASLSDRWEIGSLILVCHNCRKESLIAGIKCGWCGAERTAGTTLWKARDARRGGNGYFCTVCSNGYTDTHCPHCNTYNAVTGHTFRVKKSKAERVGTLIAAIVAAGFVILAMVLWAADLLSEDAKIGEAY